MSKDCFSIAILGNIIRKGIGDEMVCIPAYLCLKKLYPRSHVTLLTKSKTTLALLSRFSYLDEVLDIEGSKGVWKNQTFDILLIIEHNNLEVLSIAKSIYAKRKIATLSQSLLFFKGSPFLYLKHIRQIEILINPYWRQTHNEIERNLNLVRKINPKIFDEKIHSIDFSLAKLSVSSVSLERINANIKDYKKYCKKVIGIFPFAKSMTRKVNFAIEEWIWLIQILSEEFPSVLFVFVNYNLTQYHFVEFSQENIKVFYNSYGLEDLITFIQSVDGIIGVDSGHIHIADNAKIPTLEVITDRISKQWAGGFYESSGEGDFQLLPMPLNWHEFKPQYFESFLQKARGLIGFIQHHREV